MHLKCFRFTRGYVASPQTLVSHVAKSTRNSNLLVLRGLPYPVGSYAVFDGEWVALKDLHPAAAYAFRFNATSRCFSPNSAPDLWLTRRGHSNAISVQSLPRSAGGVLRNALKRRGQHDLNALITLPLDWPRRHERFKVVSS
jgi:hypothetical protein